MRRTGIPALKIPATNYNDGMLPQRLPYPSNEENLNTNNFTAALTSMGGSNTMKSMMREARAEHQWLKAETCLQTFRLE